jgi:hypothetical protein
MASSGEHPAEHVAAFHVSDAFIVVDAAAFIATGLRAGERVVALATQNHWNAIVAKLEREGVGVGRAMTDEGWVLIEADQLVEMLTTGGQVNVDAFRAAIEPLIPSGGKVRIYGEVVSLLVARGDVEGALAVERLGHEMARTLGVTILCGYHTAGPRPLTPSDIARIQQVHDRAVTEQALPTSGTLGEGYQPWHPRLTQETRD